MKQTTIDTSLLPKVWLTWETKNATNWLECATGKKSTESPDVEFNWRDKVNIYVTAGSKPKWTYIKYHPDIEMLEMAVATIPTHRKETPHEWQYAGKKYFLDKNKIVYDEEGNPQSGNFQLYSNMSGYYNIPYSESNLLNTLSRLHIHDAWKDEFVSFVGNNYYTISNGRSVEIKYSWHMQDWYNKKQIAAQTQKGKQGKLTDKLTAIPLSEPVGFAEKYPAKRLQGQYGVETVDGIMYFERVNEEWSVLRMFKRNRETGVKETERLYLSDNGKNRICCHDDKSGWIPSRRFRDYWNHYDFVNKEEASEQCKRIKYLLPIFRDDINIKTLLMTISAMPELEQLAKLGYTSIAKSIALDTYPKAALKQKFGGFYNEKETNLLRKLGMTKNQLDRYMAQNRSYGSHRVLPEMRKFFGSNLAPIDYDSFCKYLSAFDTICNSCYGLLNYIETLELDYHRFIKNLVRLSDKAKNAFTMTTDTMRMHTQLNFGTQPEVNWYFDSYSDLTRMHDAIMALKLQQDAERRYRWDRNAAEQAKKDEERRIKIDEKRKELEYEDDKYFIRLPKNGTEITNEGSIQRICIGGYVGRHSRGETNLFFLRPKDRPDTPFYAIEMNNAKNIVQIHGYCNKWLGNDPDAIPTVIRWLRKNGIKCSDEILTCKSTGYGSTRQFVQMPVVD